MKSLGTVAGTQLLGSTQNANGNVPGSSGQGAASPNISDATQQDSLLINVNAAMSRQLEILPCVGVITAGRIIRNRPLDLYKAAHHGSNNAFHKKVFELPPPFMAVIPVGLDNQFGHPHPEVMDYLE